MMFCNWCGKRSESTFCSPDCSRASGEVPEKLRKLAALAERPGTPAEGEAARAKYEELSAKMRENLDRLERQNEKIKRQAETAAREWERTEREKREAKVYQQAQEARKRTTRPWSPIQPKVRPAGGKAPSEGVPRGGNGYGDAY